jgi:hypothetical protein
VVETADLLAASGSLGCMCVSGCCYFSFLHFLFLCIFRRRMKAHDVHTFFLPVMKGRCLNYIYSGMSIINDGFTLLKRDRDVE